ncbi:hypothetical protein CUROG_06150 [Corynebacterium urogenitale]|uniref:Protein nucleotidyltransferase YdiU n=1 Tax=Corynebacterium urogenitale TaxID=2487892 RepID=A0A5J6ZA66_9CORY|nr:protein adenylyltransferase SelO family protein [Corynebacterium urogenitale]QFQ02593.1 hypothetical protein CUROG_06150 [Corynebacterium urogenitale]
MSSTTPQLPPLSSRFAEALPDLCAPWSPVPFSDDATLLLLNDSLAEELGFEPEWLRSGEGLRFLLGESHKGEAAWPQPVAQAYSGHQFGSFSPVLGDGRAVLLGEVAVDRGDGQTLLRDVHLKGSGRTPFSRGSSDGRACLGPMLREYLVSEAMHAMGIPTTRALAVILTGETVMRQRPEPGAVLVRVASSHLRVGSFQCARMLHEKKPHVLEDLLQFAQQRHPTESTARNSAEAMTSVNGISTASDAGEVHSSSDALQLLDAVARRQAELIARWMHVGFVHGVMNTDNVTISGETIDYGPCAFVDAFDPAACFSSIDSQGRYALGNQPQITMWNLQRLAEALLPLIEDEQCTDTDGAVSQANEILLKYPGYFSNAWQSSIGAALGLENRDQQTDCGTVHGGEEHRIAGQQAPLSPAQVELIDDFIAQISESKADLLTTLHQLAVQLTAPPTSPGLLAMGLSADWLDRWHAQDPDPELMLRTNPVRIPRNHLVEEALEASYSGDHTPFEDLLAAVTHPFDSWDDLSSLTSQNSSSGLTSQKFSGKLTNKRFEHKYSAPAPADFGPYTTHCGT